MIQFHTLGRLELLDPDGVQLSSVLVHAKRVALLAYLAVAAPRGFHRRDTLTALLWPELDQERARAALRKAIHYLRRSLGEDAVVGRGDEELAIGEDRIWCDAAALDRALEEGEPARAVELYRGPLLDGFFLSDAPEFERWLEVERARLRQRAFEAAWAAAERDEAAGNDFGAANWGRRAVALLPDDEGGLRRLVTLLDRLGDRAGALAAYEDFARRLARDYEIEPSAETLALIEAVRTGGPRARGRAADAAPPSGAESPARGAAGDASPSPDPPAAAAAGTAGPRGATAGTGAPPEGAVPPARPPRPERRRRVRLAVGAVLALSFLVGGRALWQGRVDAPPASIAVLPFADLSPEGDQEYFSDGMAEELIDVLARIEGVRVPARTSSFAFKGTNTDIREIARRLDVRTVLEGSVRKAGDRVRITAQLIDAETGYHLWSETFDRELTGIFEVQDEIARAIVDALRVRLPGGGETRLARAHTADPEAHALYLRGRHVWNRRTRGELEQAAVLFRRAIERDTTFALAYAGLADVYPLLVSYGHMSAGEAYPQAEAAARRALELDPTSAEALTSLAHIRLASHDWAAAGAYFRRALQLHPSYATAHHWYALLLLITGRRENAYEEIRSAIAADPLAPIPSSAYGLMLSYDGRHAEAIEQQQKVLEIEPDNPLVRVHLAYAYSSAGRHAEALRELERLPPPGDDLTYPYSLFPSILARAGEVGRARELLVRLEAEPLIEFQAPWIAMAYMALAQPDSALAWLERAEWRNIVLLLYLAGDRGLDPIRSDPRFLALRERLRLE